MSALTVTLIMFGASLFLLAFGMPIAYAIGSIGMITALVLWGPEALFVTYFSTSGLLQSFILLALPCFIFMGCILQESNFAEDLFDCIYKWFGGLRGGLAIGCVLVCVLIAAMVGVSSAATVSLGLMAIPPMMKRGYDKRLITGTIQAGGALGFLIPPSICMVGYSFISGTSLARLFAGGVVPGFMLAIMYIIYITVRCQINKDLGPPIPVDQRATRKEKIKSLKGVIIPLLVIFMVLGGIFTGVCSPTEAAGVGVLGAVLAAIIKKRLTWPMFKGSMLTTFRITGMIAWIVIAASVFSKVYTALGASTLIQNVVANAGINPWIVIVFIQLSFFILGMFLDDGAILFITMPVYIPLITSLGFDPVWFAILYVINMQMAYLTPPFGYNLFYIRSVAPPEITLKDIYLSVIPYVCIQATALILIMVFPQIVLWLPDLIFG